MSFLLDLFTNNAAQQAAQDQTQAIQQGLSYATGQIGQGNQALQTNYTAALQPFLQNQQTANQGTTQLGNVLGLNGAAGNQSALSTLQSTPGYQFQLQQGDNAVNAAAAANGTLGSGNQQLALSNYNQGLAGTTYNNYVSQLQPYLGYSTSSAAGGAGVQTGLGSALNSNSNTLANLGMNAYTSIGNANANAALAENQASANIFGALGGAASGLTNLLPFLIPSDERLKEDIQPVGELFDGTNIYSYKYKGDLTPRIGLIAQEVEKKYPEAVTEIAGFKAVDYGKATAYARELSELFKEAA